MAFDKSYRAALRPTYIFCSDSSRHRNAVSLLSLLLTLPHRRPDLQSILELPQFFGRTLYTFRDLYYLLPLRQTRYGGQHPRPQEHTDVVSPAFFAARFPGVTAPLRENPPVCGGERA